MAKKHEYVRQNIKIIHKLVKSGDASAKLMIDYRIYQAYQDYKGVKGKMDRYQFVAEDLKTSVQAVMRAVKNMETSM